MPTAECRLSARGCSVQRGACGVMAWPELKECRVVESVEPAAKIGQLVTDRGRGPCEAHVSSAVTAALRNRYGRRDSNGWRWAVGRTSQALRQWHAERSGPAA